MNKSNSPDVLLNLNAAIVSEAKVVAGSKAGYRLHGVYKENGDFVVQSTVQRGSIPKNGNSEPKQLATIQRRLGGEYLYGGEVSNHYGHLLLETFSRLKFLLQFDLPVIFCELNSKESIIFWKLIDAWGLDRERVILLSKPTIVEKLHVYPPTMVIRHGATREFAEAYELLGEKFLKQHALSGNSDDRPVYLSRSKVTDTRRYIFGERIIEKIISKAGVDVVHMQDLPVQDQILLCLRRRRFFGFSGTAFHNLLFASAPKEITFFSPKGLHGNFRIIENLKSNKWQHITPDLKGASPGGPWLLSLEGIFETCRACGLKDREIWDGLEMYREEIESFEEAQKKVVQRVAKGKRQNP